MELVCYEIAAGRVALRPAPRRRAWMDETPHAFAYHCLPLVIGNQHGWEMLCPFDLSVTWRGAAAVRSLEITVDAADEKERPGFATSHFGSGILTFNPLVILRTEPGWNLWIAGPANGFKDGVQCMTAVVETDWTPFTFSVNWKVTRPDAAIRFEKGEPFCAFFPVPRGALAGVAPRLAGIDDDPALAEAYTWARARRGLNLLGERERDKYQGWYADGEMPRRASGAAPASHETNLVLRPFKR